MSETKKKRGSSEAGRQVDQQPSGKELPAVELVDEEPADTELVAIEPVGQPSATAVHGLTDGQLRAVELLVSGLRPGVAAKRLEIARETLWRWRQDPKFRAHIQRLRVELHVARIDRVWGLFDKSMDVLEEHLDEGDLQAATTLLKLAQLNPTRALPDGPEAGDMDVEQSEGR